MAWILQKRAAMSPYDAIGDGPRLRGTDPALGADGRLAMTWRVSDGRTRLVALAQRVPYRLFSPRVLEDEPPLAVLANVSGGVVGGDRLELALTLEEGAGLSVTGQAAEKVYRAGGRLARLGNHIMVGPAAGLEWLPQGTILFDDVRLRRETAIDVAPDARLLYGECLFFGRRGMGETMRRGRIDDRLTVAVGGRVALIDRFRIDDPVALLDDPFGLDGAAAAALAVIHHGPADPPLEALRALLAEAGAGVEGLRWGATRRGPLVLVRWLGADGAALRRAFGRFWQSARQLVCGFPARLPSVWTI